MKSSLLPTAVVTMGALCLMLTVTPSHASNGDRSYVYQKCLRACIEVNCTRISDARFASESWFYMRWLGWNCPENCKYLCMWTAVIWHKQANQNVPQFFGKWPFLRIFGIQEPASVIFSILNGLSHVLLLIKLRSTVPSEAPMYYVWHFYAVIGVNAWLWSTVFHSRDFDFTEKMDYFCAISLVLSSVFVLCARVLGTKVWWKPGVCFMALLGFYIYHVYYLAFVKFDYGYNMKANIAVGILNSIGWLWWSARNYREQPYVWKAAGTTILVDLLLVLEVWDFPPIWWTFDAHSLWHAGTAPLGFLWYSFEIDDCLYQLMKEKGSLEEGKKAL